MEIAHVVVLHVMCLAAAEGRLSRVSDNAAMRYGDGEAAGAKTHLEVAIGARHLVLVLTDRSIAYDRELRLRRAFFGHGCVLNGQYVGVLHLDNGVLGTLRLNGRKYVIRGGGADMRHLNDLAVSEEDSRHSVRIRILLVNDASRTARLGSRVFEETLAIFRNARRIFEREDWGGYRISLKLSNIFSIERGPAEQMHGDESLGPRVPSDSAEEECEAGRANVLCRAPGASPETVERRSRYKRDLAGVADVLERVLAGSQREDEFHEQQDVVFLVSDEANRDIEGLSYDGCVFGQDMCLGIVFIDGGDSRFHGKVLAHELVHTLGGSHDTEGGFLMEATSSEHTKHMDARVSRATKEAVTRFLRSRGRVSL